MSFGDGLREACADTDCAISYQIVSQRLHSLTSQQRLPSPPTEKQIH